MTKTAMKRTIEMLAITVLVALVPATAFAADLTPYALDLPDETAVHVTYVGTDYNTADITEYLTDETETTWADISDSGVPSMSFIKENCKAFDGWEFYRWSFVPIGDSSALVYYYYKNQDEANADIDLMLNTTIEANASLTDEHAFDGDLERMKETESGVYLDEPGSPTDASLSTEPEVVDDVTGQTRTGDAGEPGIVDDSENVAALEEAESQAASDQNQNGVKTDREQDANQTMWLVFAVAIAVIVVVGLVVGNRTRKRKHAATERESE